REGRQGVSIRPENRKVKKKKLMVIISGLLSRRESMSLEREQDSGSHASVSANLAKRLQWPQSHGDKRRNQPAYRTGDQGEEHDRCQRAAINRELQNNRSFAPLTGNETGSGAPVGEKAQSATQNAAQKSNHDRLEEE